MLQLLKKYRVPVLIVAHLFLFFLIYTCAYLLRFDFSIPENYLVNLQRSLIPVVLLKIAVFYLLRNFHGWWRHVTFGDFVALLRASAVSLCAIYVLDHLLLDYQIPRSVVFIDALLSLLILGSLRSTWRFLDEVFVWKSSKNKRTRVLLVGNGFDDAKLAYTINSNPSWNMEVVGLVGANTSKPYTIGQISVIGPIANLQKLASDYRVKTVLVTKDALQARDLRRLMDTSIGQDFQLRVLSNIGEHLLGQKRIPVRDVSVEDLLRRPSTRLDQTAIGSLIRGKVLLVSGAGGSIGSELCRQLASFGPAEIVLLGRGENRIFHVERELIEKFPQVRFSAWIASVTDVKRMRALFDQNRPQIVFHAAAHKHVPLTEKNVGEAVHNNVFGTKVIADIAVEFGVEEFVLVSTDKAVNPTSVMGCTKQLAERYCLALGNHQNKTKFVVTRFGNVLGSAGSVVPIFQEQIRNGGPVTITDERMTRFFMTIPEAAQLVIQASTMGKGGEIFVLNMGEQVKIVDMARDLIRLAGLKPDDIEIKFTGIRPGEKLYEELYYNEEEAMPTSHEKLLTAYHRPFDFTEVKRAIDELIDATFASENKIRQLLLKHIPEFRDGKEADAGDVRELVESRE
jgi:FlaA1/EpsC-like NDP-sugar epimerase